MFKNKVLLYNMQKGAKNNTQNIPFYLFLASNSCFKVLNKYMYVLIIYLKKKGKQQRLYRSVVVILTAKYYKTYVFKNYNLL